MKQLNELEKNIDIFPQKTLDKALDLYNQNNSFKDEIYLLYIMASCSWILGSLNKANQFCQKIIEKSKLNKYVFKAYKILGNIATDSQDYLTSYEYYQKSLNTYILKDKCLIYNNIGTLFFELENYEKALYYYKKALEIDSKKDHILVYSNIGEVYVYLNEFDKAKENLKKASNLLKNYSSNYAKGVVNLQWGFYYFKVKNFNKALEFNERSIKAFNKSDLMYRKIETLIQKSKIYNELDDFIQAIEILQGAKKLSLNYDDYKFRKEIFSKLAKAFDKVKNSDKSLYYYKKFHDFYKKEISILKNKKNNMLNTKIKIKEISKKNELVKTENEKLKEANSNLELISNIGKNIISTLDIKILTKRLANSLMDIITIDYFGTGLYESNISDNYFYRVNKKEVVNYKKSLDKVPLIKRVYKSKTSIFSNDYHKEYKKYKSSKKITKTTPKSIIYIPIHFKDEILGFFTIQSLHKYAYKESDLKLLNKLAPFVGIALNNCIKSKKLKEKNDENIKIKNKLKEKNKKLKYLSDYDQLTDIPNRRYLISYLKKQLNLSKRNENSLAILFIDVDNFKLVNDKYGHIKGDKCIIRVSKIIKESLKRKSDFIARYGGDELVVILPNVDENGIIKVIKRIQKNININRFQNIFSIENEKISLSIGVFLKTKEFNKLDYKYALNKADKALYLSKDKGKDTYTILTD
ncbi:MAG: sensor domain-containing diguanylate cyclase [Bacillota bacterium]